MLLLLGTRTFGRHVAKRENKRTELERRLAEEDKLIAERRSSKTERTEYG